MGNRTSLKDDFERWAQLSARMLRRPAVECARIVRNAGVENEWNAADAHWYGVLIDDLEAGRLERVARYRALCRGQLDERAASGALVASPLDALALDPADPTPAFARSLVSPGARAVQPVHHQDDTHAGLEAAHTAPREGHDWTIEQYAWLRAELERYPERADRIWSLRGVERPASREAVVETWEERLHQSPPLRAQYEDLMARYRSMLL